ncbi:uncharacterized protein LOC110384790 isoform X2 [Bombyx mori]
MLSNYFCAVVPKYLGISDAEYGSIELNHYQKKKDLHTAKQPLSYKMNKRPSSTRCTTDKAIKLNANDVPDDNKVEDMGDALEPVKDMKYVKSTKKYMKPDSGQNPFYVDDE